MIAIAILFFFILLCLNLNERVYNNRRYIITITLCFFLIAAFRDGSNLYDYSVYVENFEHYEDRIIELSFVMISSFIHHYLNGEVAYLFIIYAALAVFIKCYAIKEISNLFVPSAFIYFSNFYIAQEWIQIRSGVAAAFLFISLKFVFDRKLLSFTLCIICATFFHTSALLFFFIYFLNPYKVSKKTYVFLFAISYFLYFIHVDFLSVLSMGAFMDIINFKLEAYKRIEIGSANVFSIAQILKSFITFVILFKIEKICKYNKYSIILVKTMVISLCVLPLFATDAVAGNRIRDLFGFVEIALFPLIIYCFRKKKEGIFTLSIVGFMLFSISLFNLLLKY